MRTDGGTDIYGSKTTVRLGYKENDGRTGLDLAGWADQNLYDEASFDSTELHVQGKVTRRSQRAEASMDASGDHDTTRTGELTSLGLTTSLARRDRVSLAPNIVYVLTPLDSIGLSGSFAKTTYDTSLYTDYHTASVSPNYTRQFSPDYSGLLSFNLRRYESDTGVKRLVDSFGPMLGGAARLSEKTTLQINGGQEASRRETGGVVTQDWTWDSVYATSLAFAGEVDRINLSASRAQQSYANGGDYLLTSFSARQTHKINSLLSANIGANYQYSDVSASSLTNLDYLYSGDAEIRYAITNEVGLLAGYRYKYEARTNAPDAATEQVARLGVAYRCEWGLGSP